MGERTTVVLVDDHALVRDMLYELLSREGMEVVERVSSAERAVELVTADPPDVVVFDIDMPGISAFVAAREVQKVSPSTRVIFLSAFVHDSYIEQALEVGASGYLTKADPPQAIVDGIRRVSEGGTCFSTAVLDRMVIDSAGARLAHGNGSRLALLTDREREMLSYIARGSSQRQVARIAGISIKTVQHHITSVMDKLEIHDRVELTLFAIREGLVEA